MKIHDLDHHAESDWANILKSVQGTSLAAPPHWHEGILGSQLPKVEFAVGWTTSALLVRFAVRDTEDTWRCECKKDQDPVWQDSCCEVFLRCRNGHYMNVECNPVGVILAARGSDRQQRIPLGAEELHRIERHCEGTLVRSISLKIPFSLLEFDSVPKTIEGNAYKCGDLCRLKHWLVLSPIHSPKPDFHRPEAFSRWELG